MHAGAGVEATGSNMMLRLMLTIGMITILPSIMSFLPSFDPLMMLMLFFFGANLIQHVAGGGGAANNANAKPGGETGNGYHGSSSSNGHTGRSSGGSSSSTAPPPKSTVEQLLEDTEKLLEAAQFDKAAAKAEKALEEDPESAKGWILLTKALRNSGKSEEAFKAVEKAIDLYEIDNRELNSLRKELEKESKDPLLFAKECKENGNTHFKDNQFDAARNWYTKGVEALLPPGADPGSLSEEKQQLRLALLNNRAACAQQLQDWSSMRHDASEVLRLDASNQKARLRRAISNEALEKCEEALEDARAVLRVDPANQSANQIQHRMGSEVRRRKSQSG